MQQLEARVEAMEAARVRQAEEIAREAQQSASLMHQLAAPASEARATRGHHAPCQPL